jgi:Fur family peroxide stress response transcriptional regulator
MIIHPETSPQVRFNRMLGSLKSSRLRLTPQRIAICRELSDNTDHHPTAQMVHERLRAQFPTMSLATVYKTLNTLREMGVIHSLGHANDGKEHFETNPEPHINLVCIRCHRIVDFRNAPVRQVKARVEAESGFKLVGARLVFYGECAECRNRKGSQGV